MAQFEGKSRKTLDYGKVKASLNKIEKNNCREDNTLDSLLGTMENLQKDFLELNQEEKEEELNSVDFTKLNKRIKELNCKSKEKLNKANKIILEMLEYKQPSEIDKIMEYMGQLKNELEKEIKNSKNKKLDEDISQILEKVSRLLTENQSIHNQSFHNLQKKMDNISDKLHFYIKENESVSNEIRKILLNIRMPKMPKIPTDYLKEEYFDEELGKVERNLKKHNKDIEGSLKFLLSSKLQNVEENIDDLSVLPKKVQQIDDKLEKLSEKIDNIEIGDKKQNNDFVVPKEMQAIEDLTKYMRDGLGQLEFIAKEYVDKKEELDNLTKLKQEHKKEIERVKEESFEKGEEKGRKVIIENIAKNSPSIFLELKDIFGAYIEEQFQKDEILNITEQDKLDIARYVDIEIEEGEYKVISTAILLDDEVLIKADLEKVQPKEKEEIKEVKDETKTSKIKLENEIQEVVETGDELSEFEENRNEKLIKVDEKDSESIKIDEVVNKPQIKNLPKEGSDE